MKKAKLRDFHFENQSDHGGVGGVETLSLTMLKNQMRHSIGCAKDVKYVSEEGGDLKPLAKSEYKSLLSTKTMSTVKMYTIQESKGLPAERQGRSKTGQSCKIVQSEIL
ncbi:hypothetical protein RUM43_014018 [Polyplax serrata]|uniref:Uncharacterized protein n=1 Tax=Polyplax serrata TaxID=468196 RepID=A0AAN8S6V6_POLSC